MKLANPNEKLPFEKIYKDSQGEDEWGSRTIEGGNEELVNLKTGKSNVSYFKPELVIGGECNHTFKVTNAQRREIECFKCGWSVSFHISTTRETKNGLFVKINNKDYLIS